METRLTTDSKSSPKDVRLGGSSVSSGKRRQFKKINREKFNDKKFRINNSIVSNFSQIIMLKVSIGQVR